MKFYRVGSSIQGNLLKPNDYDIAIVVDTFEEFCNIKANTFVPDNFYSGEEKYKEDGYLVSTSKQGKLNYILLLGITIEQYVKDMDVDIVKGWIEVETNKLTLLPEAEKALETKTMTMDSKYNPHRKWFNDYTNGERSQDRAKKYIDKLPEGWTLIVKN